MLSLVLHWIHLLSVVFWIGGVAYLLLVLLPNLRLIALRDRAKLVPELFRRFMVVIWVSIALITVSGLYRVFFVLGFDSLNDLTASYYGNVLLIKLLLVAALFGVALSVTFRVRPSVVSHVKTHLNDPPESYACAMCKSVAGPLRAHLALGLALASVIILLAALLRGA